MRSPGSSFSSGSNPFAGPDMALIRDLNIADRVPFLLHSHVDGSVDSKLMVNDEEWMIIDATIIRWFYLTISTDLFHTVVADEDDARAVRLKLNGLFTDNKLQRKVLLHGEFYGCHQLDSSIDDYRMRLKKIADELRDLGEPIGDELLITTFTAGLHEDYGNAASNLTLLPDPTFPKVVAYLKLEERRAADGAVPCDAHRPRHRHPRRPLRPRCSPSAARLSSPAGLPAGAASTAAGPTRQQQQSPPWGSSRRPPASSSSLGRSNRPRAALPVRSRSSSRLLGTPGENPWTGVVHAYTMPVPRAPAPASLARGHPPHQAYFAAPQPYMPPYGWVGQPSQPGGLPPLPRCRLRLGIRPSSPRCTPLRLRPPTAAVATGTWTRAPLLIWLPTPVLFIPPAPVTTSTRITVGNGSSLPITHIGHASLPSSSTPLSLSNVLVSPNLIKNLVSVKQFTRDNPVTVEFDLFGFSVKDSRTRMVLLRCDSPGDLYPVHSSPSTSAAPVALATGVDLWHARLGHPNPRHPSPHS
nr:uncharacterized protein LOC127347824 [Lolium perenne]